MVWLEMSESQFSKTFFGLKIGWILRKLWAKMLWALTGYFGGARGHFIQSTLSTLSAWVTWVTIKTVKASFDPFNMGNMSNN